jgi:hypothetical protein
VTLSGSAWRIFGSKTNATCLSDIDKKVILTGASFVFKEAKKSSMKSRRPNYQSGSIEGSEVVRFMENITPLRTYNLFGAHLAAVRAISTNTKGLRCA